MKNLFYSRIIFLASTFFVVSFLLSKLVFPCLEKGVKCNTFIFTPFNYNTSFIGEGSDDLEYMGFMYLTNKNISEFKHPFANNNYLRYPKGFDYSFGFDGAASVLIGSFLAFFIPLPVAYTSTVIILLTINFIISYLFFYKILALFYKSYDEVTYSLKVLISSIVFALSPFVFARASSHLNLVFVAGFVVVSYFSIKIYKTLSTLEYASKIDYLGLLLGIYLVSLGSLQYLILGVYLTAMLVFVIFFTRPRVEINNLFKCFKNRSNLKSTIIPLVSFLFLFCFTFYGYVYAIFTNLINLSALNHKVFETELINFIVPNSYLNVAFNYLNPTFNSIEKVIALGIVGTVVYIYTLISKDVFKLLKVTIVLISILWVITGLGLITLPFFPEGGRLIVPLLLFVAMGNLFTNYKKWFYTVILVVLITERLFYSFYVSQVPGLSYKRFVPELENTTLLSIPLSKYSQNTSVYPYVFGKKIFDGYYHYTGDTKRSTENFSKISPLRYFNCNHERDLLNTKDYTLVDVMQTDKLLNESNTDTIILHKKDSLAWLTQPSCSEVLNYWSYYSVPTIYLSNNINSVVSSEVTTLSGGKDLRLVSLNKGELFLTGLVFYPSFDGSVEVFHNGLKLISTSVDGISGGTSFNPVLRIEMDSMDEVNIVLNGDLNSPTTIKPYYAYYISQQSRDETINFSSRTLQEVYSDIDISVFVVKYK